MSYKTVEGHLNASGLKIGILVSRFNSLVTERLLSGALDAISRHGGDLSQVDVVRTPGSWEMPVVVAQIAREKKHDALVCLGAVIKGDTPHNEYIANEAAKGIAQVALETGVPISFGMLTTNTLEQAIDRAGAKSGNKGFDAAVAAIETADLLRRLREAM